MVEFNFNKRHFHLSAQDLNLGLQDGRQRQSHNGSPQVIYSYLSPNLGHTSAGLKGFRLVSFVVNKVAI